MSVLVIDNNAKYMKIVKKILAESVGTENIFSYQASFRSRAWEGIQTMESETVVLPLHLTEEKNFEGLWLAEKIYESELNILTIIIVSNLSSEKRQGIINITSFTNLHAPHFLKAKDCLNGNCSCKIPIFDE